VLRTELTEDEALRVAGLWWLIGLVGVASVVAGGILVAEPSHSLATLAVVFGIFLLLDGIVELIRSFGHEVENRGLAAIIGVLGVIVGVVLIRHPTHAISLIGLIIGIWLVAAGVLRLVGAIVVPGRRVWRLAIAILETAVGIAVVSDPHIGYAALAILLGIWLILNGIGTIIVAFALRAAKTALAAQTEPAA
jgi:uncharacterized membrane protein HdeD (DUF308 family)